MFCEDVKEGEWRIGPNGMIKTVEATSLPVPDDFRIRFVDPPVGKSCLSPTLKAGFDEAGFDFDMILGDHADNNFIEEGDENELEGFLTLQKEQMIEAEPLNPFLEERFSKRMSGCNNLSS